MKKYYTNGKDIISIYRYMEVCGLHCKFKKNVRISHSIMEKKLTLRHNEFPSEVFRPVRISFEDYNHEDVLSGKIVEVVDDYNKVIAYRNPLLLQEETLFNYLNFADKKSLKKIRKALLEEQGYNISASGIIDKKVIYDYEPDITEKINRNKKLEKNRRR